MQIYDNIGINDTIHGQYIIKNSDGKIIVSQHNTITLDGRKFILAQMVKNALDKNSDLSDYDNLTFSKIAFMKTNNLTNYNLKYTDIADNITAEVNIDNSDITINANANILNSTKIDMYMSISKSLTVTESTQFSSIAMILDNKTNAGANQKIFSRIIIDPVYLNTNETYRLVYYVYF